MEVRLRAYSTLDAEGIPLSDAAELDVICDGSSDCSVPEHSPLGWTVAISSAATWEMMVVDAYFATQEAEDLEAGVNHYSVSWAIRAAE